LRRHGFEFDVVYTSWLTRAIQTAFYVMDELDSTWLPLVKSWRLNERMYGALTGKSKRQIEAEYGEDQLKTWRRGYTVRPPPISVYSPNSPGNDLRRAKHFDDLPLSIKESFFRSLEARKLVVHRKFPRTESLKCCMDRTLPFYRDRIRVDAVNRGRRVLIASHENAIRGILMHLCDIPESAMSQLHLPNGLPLVYNVKGKCIALLEGEEDESEGAELHDFGPAAQYLFRTCKIDDDFYERMQQQV
jgi:2,3-bisphosphoglycerate-dependent phosphoglycerate mutase